MAHCCVQILKPNQSVSLPIRFVHIKPLPVETDPTDVLLGLPRRKPRNLVNRKLDTHRHAPQLALENYHAPPQIPDFQIVFMHMCHHDGLLVHRSIWPENLVVNRYSTRLHAPPGFLISPPRAGEHTRSCHAPKFAADVIWRHRMTSSLHVSSHASMSTSATRHKMTSVDLLLDPWPDLETQNRPEPVSVDFDPGLVDFDFLRWLLTKSQNFRQNLSCSVFSVDSNFELRFFVWSSKIGQLAHSSLWFLQWLYSWHLQEIFSCLSNLKPSSSFRLEFEGGC